MIKFDSGLGLVLLRVTVGLTMLLGHGWGKLTGFSEMSATFPDPIGLGSQISLGLTVFAEVFCSIALIVGFKTRIFAIPLFITMAVAFFIIHGADPFRQKELAFLFGMIYLTLMISGGGNWALELKKKS